MQEGRENVLGLIGHVLTCAFPLHQFDQPAMLPRRPYVKQLPL